jgi:protein-disulfide isomerase
MKHPCLYLLKGLILAVPVALTACAAPQPMERLQSDVTALRAEVAALSERFDRLDKRLRPPEPSRVTVAFGGRPLLGDGAARVGIIEFSDFQCPFCQRFHTTVQPLLRKNYIDTGKVQMIFRDLPLDFHPLAKDAAVAVNCAGAQGHYWDMADALFDDQERLGEGLYRELAGRFGLDMKLYQTCLADPASLKVIEQSTQEAVALGIEGTPTFLIGRVEGDRLVDALTVVGAQPYPALAQVIDSFLDGSVPPSQGQ